MIKAVPIPFPFALFLLAPRILAQNQPTSTKRGKTDWYQAETFPFRVPLFPQSTLPLSFLETRIQHEYKQRLLIEPPAVPATSLFSRKDGIADPDHFEIKRLNSTRKRGLCTWPVIEPAHNGRCSLPRTGFKGSFAVDIDRENGETVFPCISFCSIERERTNGANSCPLDLCYYYLYTRSIYCERMLSILNDRTRIIWGRGRGNEHGDAILKFVNENDHSSDDWLNIIRLEINLSEIIKIRKIIPFNEIIDEIEFQR